MTFLYIAIASARNQNLENQNIFWPAGVRF